MSRILNSTSATVLTERHLRNQRIIKVICWTPLSLGLTYIGWVKWKLRRSSHRPFTPTDMYYMKKIGGGVPQITENPGIRVEPSFLNEAEQEDLRFDSRILVSHYGYSVIPFYVRRNFNKQIAFLKSDVKVNAFKVTGREPQENTLNPNRTKESEQMRQEREALIIKTNPWESNEPNAAPWNVGHSFDIKQLPQSFQNLIKKIQSLEGYSLGGIRDVSIDFREHGYFRLDPQIHPMRDGETVFFVTLESDTVMTFIPENEHQESDVSQISQYSWTNNDIDVLHKRGDLLCITDRCRHDMEYGIRQGLDGNIEKLQQVRKNQMLRIQDSSKFASARQEMTDAIRSSFDINRKDKQDADSSVKRQTFWQMTQGSQFNYDHSYVAANLTTFDKFNSDQNENDKQQYVMCNWWGTPENIVPRCKEKILIAVSFARPT